MNFSTFNSLFESKHKINKKEVKRVEKKPNPLIESLNKSKPLWERKWEIVIPGSYRKSALDAGEDEDYETFKQSLMDACNYVIDKSEDEDIIEAYEEYIEDIEYSDIEDEDDANYWLNELYDLLDNTNVFLGIDESLTQDGRSSRQWLEAFTPHRSQIDLDEVEFDLLGYFDDSDMDNFLDIYMIGDGVRKRADGEEYCGLMVKGEAGSVKLVLTTSGWRVKYNIIPLRNDKVISQRLSNTTGYADDLEDLVDIIKALDLNNLNESLHEEKIVSGSMDKSDREILNSFIEFIDKIQNKNKENFCITWNFGRNQDGKMTGGIDFHTLKKDFDMSDVLDEFASNIESTGFEFDDSIGYGRNPWRESNIFGKSYHTQVIEIDDGLSEGFNEAWDVNFYNELDADFGYDPGPGRYKTGLDKATAKSIARALDKRTPKFISYWADEDDETKETFESLRESKGSLDNQIWDIYGWCIEKDIDADALVTDVIDDYLEELGKPPFEDASDVEVNLTNSQKRELLNRLKQVKKDIQEADTIGAISRLVDSESSKEFNSSSKIVGKSWQEFISNIEAQTGYNVDSAYKEGYEQWIELIDKETGKIYDGEVTRYSDGSYELMLYNITPSYYQESLNESTAEDENLKEFWVSFYLQDGTQKGGSYTGTDINDVEWQLRDEFGDDFGGIADYGEYDDSLDESLNEAIPRNFNEKSRDVINKINNLGIDENPDAGNSEKEIEMPKTNPTIEKFLKVLGLKQHPEFSNDFFFLTPIPAPSPFEKPLRRGEIRDIDPETGKCEIELSNLKWWCDYPTFRSREIDSYKELFNFFKRNPVGNSSIMKIVDEYFNKYESLTEARASLPEDIKKDIDDIYKTHGGEMPKWKIQEIAQDFPKYSKDIWRYVSELEESLNPLKESQCYPGFCDDDEFFTREEIDEFGDEGQFASLREVR